MNFTSNVILGLFIVGLLFTILDLLFLRDKAKQDLAHHQKLLRIIDIEFEGIMYKLAFMHNAQTGKEIRFLVETEHEEGWKFIPFDVPYHDVLKRMRYAEERFHEMLKNGTYYTSLKPLPVAIKESVRMQEFFEAPALGHVIRTHRFLRDSGAGTKRIYNEYFRGLGSWIFHHISGFARKSS